MIIVQEKQFPNFQGDDQEFQELLGKLDKLPKTQTFCYEQTKNIIMK